MRSLLSKEVLVGIFVIFAWLAAAMVIAYPLADKSVVRSLLMVAMSLSAMIYGVVKTSPRLRFYFHKLRYRLFGPTYQVRAGGTFRAGLTGSESTLLTVGLRTAEKVYRTARTESSLTNRIVISAHSRTIRLDLPQELEDGDEDGLDDIGESLGFNKLVEVTLWGYEANSTRIADLVENEIVPFFDNLREAMEAEAEGRNFWLKITLPGRNPFLQFYLRDVPDADVSKFQLEFTQDIAGDKARVAILKEGFSVSAFTPRPFARLIRAYLSTPALANSDRN